MIRRSPTATVTGKLSSVTDRSTSRARYRRRGSARLSYVLEPDELGLGSEPAASLTTSEGVKVADSVIQAVVRDSFTSTGTGE